MNIEEHWFFIKTTPLMIFVTETKTGTMVKHVPQEQVVNFRSYPSRDVFSR